MKKISVAFLLLFLFLSLYAQVPQGFHYQAVIRDADGRILQDQTLGLRLTILQGGETGPAVYSETHDLTTTAQGLFSVVVGAGDVVSGDFSAIDWQAGPYFLKVETDLSGGNDYTVLGTSALTSVPYALYAQNVTNKDDADADPQNEIQDLQLNGNILTITRKNGATSIDLSPYLDNPGWSKRGDTLVYTGSVGVGTESVGGSKLAVRGDDVTSEAPLFEVKRKDGQTVFAVYNDSIRMYVNDAPGKGLRGGFAIGGYNFGKGVAREYLRVTPDSVRIYINDAETKNPRGGFAIGGYNFGKGMTREYLRVTDDSTRVYVKNNAKNPRGGFAIGGYNFGKGPAASKFMDLTPENYLIGHEAGKNITTGLYNSFLGYRAGMNNTIGRNNVLLGYQAGIGNVSGSRNIFLGESTGADNKDGNDNIYFGYYAGHKNVGEKNTFLGVSAGSDQADGDLNIFIGNEAGRYLDYGTQNIFLGYRSGVAAAGVQSNASQNIFIGDYIGFWLTTGSQNVQLGGYCGSFLSTGSYNVMSGGQGGYQMSDGNNNVFLGAMSGTQNKHGSGNVLIGFKAGYNELYSGKLYIENSDADSTGALIYGDFNKDLLTVNGMLGVGTVAPSERLEVNGNIALTPGANRFIGLPDGLHTLVLGPSSPSDYPWGILLTAHGTVRIRIDDDPAKGMNMNGNGYVGFGIQTPSYRIELPNTAGAGGRARANQWLTYSDRRIKKHRHALDYGLAQVMALKPVRYEQHASNFCGGSLQLEKQEENTIGMVAQDVYEVIPEAVEKPENEQASLWSMDYQKLIPVMVKGMQEQQQLIEEMRKKIEVLEKEVKRLKKR